MTALIGSATRADMPGPRAIVDKAVEAHGGAANLRHYQAYKYKASGKMYSGKRVMPFSGEYASQWPDRAWEDFEFESQGHKYHVIAADDGPRHWTSLNGKKYAMSNDGRLEGREKIHADWIASLRALLDRSIPVTSAAEANVDGRPAVRVTVTDKGYRPVKLFFDKETGLLLKTEMVVKDLGSHQEITLEQFYSDYHTIQGVKVALRSKTLKGGKLFVESEKSHMVLSEKLDDRLFSEP